MRHSQLRELAPLHNDTWHRMLDTKSGIKGSSYHATKQTLKWFTIHAPKTTYATIEDANYSHFGKDTAGDYGRDIIKAGETSYNQVQT